MTKFVFPISLVNSLQTSDRKVAEKFGIKEEGGITITLFPQYFYQVTTVQCRDKVTLERKVADELVKLPVLARRKGNNPDPKKISARAAIKMGEDVDPKAAQLMVWETKRESYKVELETATIYPKKSHQYQEGQIVKHDKFDWLVASIEHDPVQSTEKVAKVNQSERLFVNDFFGGRLITKLRELHSPLNRVIGKLCGLQNEGKACISGQLHQTTKALHTSRELNNIDEFTIWQRHVEAKHSHMRNKLQEIKPLIRGQWKEEVLFGEKGEYLGRNFTSMDEEGRRGWQPVEDVETILESEAKLIKLDPVKTPKPASDPSWKEPSWVPMQMSF